MMDALYLSFPFILPQANLEVLLEEEIELKLKVGLLGGDDIIIIFFRDKGDWSLEE